MSNPFDYIQKHPERTQGVLGLTYQQWQQLTKKAIALRAPAKLIAESKKQHHINKLFS